MITVHASTHPLKDRWVTAEVSPQQTVLEIAGTRKVHAWINGAEIPAWAFDKTKIKDEQTLVLRPVPQDDDILRGVLTVVVAVVSAYTGGTVGAAYGSVWGSVAGAAVSIAGSIAINAIVPPNQPSPNEPATGSFNRLAALTGSANQVAAFQPIPRLYGRMRYFPPIPMTAEPYTELEGSDQYLRMKLVLGYGPLAIGGNIVGRDTDGILTESDNLGDAIRIGETDIHLFDEVEYEIGRPDQMTLYTSQVIETNPAFTTDSADTDGWTSNGDEAIRTTETDVTEIAVEIQAQLFSVNDKGKTRNARIEWKIEYRETGSSSWTVEKDPWVTGSTKRETLRRAYRWKVPKGQYDVRLTRIRTYHKDDAATANDATWSALRSIRGGEEAFNVPGMVVMDLRIKATDQLSGRLDNVSVLATSVLKAWDGTGWADEITRNPAWIYADILCGTANRRPIPRDDLNTAAIKDWADANDNDNRTYDNVFDSDSTVLDRAREVAATGLASWAIDPDTSISVVRDVAQTTPRMVVTPRNSWGFSYEASALEIPDGLRIRFVSDDTWENTERLVFDDGFDESNAQLYEVLEAPGVTNPEQAWKYGRYHLASQKLRPERYSFSQDVQHMRYRRGDLLTLAHDSILVGLAWGRVKSVTTDGNGDVTGFVSDELLPMEPDTDYAVRLQRSDGSITTVGVVTNPPGVFEVTLDSPVADIEPDDHFAFGEKDSETIDVKVSAIEPEGDYQARIRCVPAAPAVLDADQGPIPGFDPVMTDPVDPDKLQMPVPEITRIVSDESVLLVDTDGHLRTRIVVETTVSAFGGFGIQRQVRFRPSDEDGWRKVGPTEDDALSIVDVDEGVQYDLQARTVRGQRVSAWSPVLTHTVVGKSSAPPDVTGFVADAARDRVELTWNSSTAPDIDRYEIREQDSQGQAWEDATLLARPDSTDYQTGRPRSGPFLIKAVDVSGNESENATQAILTVEEPQVTGVTGEVIDNNVLLRWSAEQGTFDIQTFEVRRGSDVDTADVVGNSDTTFTSLFETEAGQFRYWIVPVDAAGIEGQAASRVLDVDVPPDFVLRNIFNTDWQGYTADNLVPVFRVPAPARLTTRDYTALEFDGVDDYVQIGDALDRTGTFTVEALVTPLGTGPIISKDGGNGWALVVEPDGVLRFRHAELNTVNTDSPALAMREGVFQHVAAVFDTAADTTTLYVEGAQVAQVTGQTNGITANAAELRIGADDQGNYGEHRIAEARLWGAGRTQTEIQDWRHRTLDGNESDLDGYWRLQEGEDEVAEDFSGGGNDGNIVGASYYTPGVEAVLGAQNLSRDDLSALGYSSRDAMIAAGLNYRAQPAAGATFEEVYDAGTVVPRTGIQVTFGYQELAPGATVTTQISVRETQADPWTDLPTGPQGFATDFRYVKVAVSITTDGTGLLRVDELQSRLASKQRSDAGRVEVNANPTTVDFNVDFIDVRGLTTTPQGTTPLQTVVDFDDSANPTSFDVYLFDDQGNATTGVVRWEARGF